METQCTTEITRFFQHLFGSERGLLHVWTGVRDEDGEIPKKTILHNNFNYPGAAKDAAEWALQKNEQGREVYFCCNLLEGPRRKKENTAPISALWADLDGAALPNGDLQPTAIVESSPGKFHIYYGLDAPIPPETAEDLNRRLAHEIGADSGWHRGKLLRLPFTTNHKYDDRPIVGLVSIENGFRSARKLDELLPEIEDNYSEAGPTHGPDDDVGEPPVVLGQQALKVWRGEDPRYKDTGEIDTSATLVKIGRALFDAGANRQVVIAGIKERDATLGYRKYTDRADAEKRYAEIFDELKEHGRTATFHVISGGRKDRDRDPETPLEMEEAAFRGIFGRIVNMVDPHTEGDPVAVLGSALTYFGNAIGRGPYMQVGATKHRANLFCALVGRSAKGRKGSASDPVEDIMRGADLLWGRDRITSGLSSGEGLINEVRDPVYTEKDGEFKLTDSGAKDKRLLVAESELSQALKVMKREGNTLSPIMRCAWDGRTLRTMVKQSPLRATDPHISILGYVTEADLTRHLTETEMANGLANRFLWLQVRRSKSLPFGGEWFSVDTGRICGDIKSALEHAEKGFRLLWADDAKSLWVEAYEQLTEERPGLFGAITARAEAQALRLAMIYALADCSRRIHRSHVESALAVWSYGEESARRIFGDAVGDPDADKVLAALKAAEDGLTRTEIRDLFGRNKGASELDRIQAILLRAGRIRIEYKQGGKSKKPTETWYAA